MNLNRKVKSFFEDFIIVIVLITVIYGSYSLFIDDSSSTFESSQTAVQTVEEQKQDIKEVTQDEAIKDVITDENPDNEITNDRVPPAFAQNNFEENSSKQIVENEPVEKFEKVEKIENKVLEKQNQIDNNSEKKLNLIENSKLEKSASDEEQLEKEKFYKNLKDKLYANIDKNLDKTTFKDPVFAEIRITILKDGKYEQLLLTNGDTKFFNSIKNSISSSFPIEINPILKNIFPRYYRLKIELN